MSGDNTDAEFSSGYSVLEQRVDRCIERKKWSLLIYFLGVDANSALLAPYRTIDKDIGDRNVGLLKKIYNGLTNEIEVATEGTKLIIEAMIANCTTTTELDMVRKQMVEALTSINASNPAPDELKKLYRTKLEYIAKEISSRGGLVPPAASVEDQDHVDVHDAVPVLSVVPRHRRP